MISLQKKVLSMYNNNNNKNKNNLLNRYKYKNKQIIILVKKLALMKERNKNLKKSLKV